MAGSAGESISMDAAKAVISAFSMRGLESAVALEEAMDSYGMQAAGALNIAIFAYGEGCLSVGRGVIPTQDNQLISSPDSSLPTALIEASEALVIACDKGLTMAQAVYFVLLQPEFSSYRRSDLEAIWIGIKARNRNHSWRNAQP